MKKGFLDESDAKVLPLLAKVLGVETVINGMEKTRGEMEEQESPALKEFELFFKKCWFYTQPITMETKVQKGIIVDKYERDGDIYFLFFGEDGKIHNDDDDCMMGKDKENMETYLSDLREELIAGGDL